MSIFINKKQIVALNEIWPHIEKYIPEHIVNHAKTVLQDWIFAPSSQDINDYEKQKGPSLNYAFEKHFDCIEDLIKALIGNIHAKKNLQEEEKFAFYGLKNFTLLRYLVLDELVEKIGVYFENQNKTRPETEIVSDQEFLDNHWFGPVAQVEWKKGWKQVKHNLQTGYPLEQLYKIITVLNRFNWPITKQDKATKFRLGPTPNREEHAASNTMRKDPWTLDEQHPQIISDRMNGVPVWGGTSGSTMDMINSAKQLGIVDPIKLTALAHSIAIFYHFAPTKYVVHTFHEVMRGAKIIAPEIYYDLSQTGPPFPALITNLVARQNKKHANEFFVGPGVNLFLLRCNKKGVELKADNDDQFNVAQQKITRAKL